MAAIKLAEQGVNVVVNYVTAADAADQVVKKVRELGVKCIAVQTDVSIEALQDMFTRAIQELWTIGFCFSNDGIGHFGAIGDVKGEDIDRALAINVKTIFRCARGTQAYV